MLALLAAAAVASYPTETPTWITPEHVSKWPTDTEPWGAPPTEFPSDGSDEFATSAIIGITIAALAAASVIVVCIVILLRSRRPPSVSRDYEHIRAD